MRNQYALLILVFSISFNATGQVTWQRGYFPFSIFYDVKQTTDSGYIATGIKEQGVGSLVVVRTNHAGDTLWTRTLTSSYGDMGTYVTQTLDGGYVVTSNQTVPDRAAIIRMDSNGDTLWSHLYEFNGNSFLYQTKQTADSGFITIGSTRTSMLQDIILMKLSSQGNLLWSKRYSSSTNCEAYSVLEKSDGGFIFVGYFDSSACIIRTNNLGDTIWTKGYDYLGGWDIYFSNDHYTFFGPDQLLTRTDSSGNIIWNKRYEGFNVVRGGFDLTSDGCVISGLRLDSLFNQYGFIIKTDSLGDTLWCRNYFTYSARFSNVKQTLDGGLILSGATNGSWYGGLFKTDANGYSGCGETSCDFMITTQPVQAVYPDLIVNSSTINIMDPGYQLSAGTGISIFCSSLNLLHYEYFDFGIYPIPVTSFFKIRSIAGSEVSLLNTMGERIFSLFVKSDEETINCENLQPGIYFVQVQSKYGTSVQKLIKQ